MKVKVSDKSQHVYWYPEGWIHEGFGPIKEGWYFYNEAELIEDGPFLTEDIAIAKMHEYAVALNRSDAV